jgi:hypothetical protein
MEGSYLKINGINIAAALKKNLRRFSEIYYPPRKLSINSAGAARKTINEPPMCDILRLLFWPCRKPPVFLDFP